MQFLFDTILEYPIWSAILGVLMLIALFFSKNNFLKFILILATPTTPIEKLKKGKSEIKGKVKAIDTIKETGLRAVYHKHIEEEFSSGEDGGWEVVDQDETSIPFQVVDKTGTVLIKPENAVVDLTKKSERLITHSSTSRTKHFYLLDGDEVYILGDYKKETEESFISKKEGDQFIISNVKEGKLLLKYGFKGMVYFLITLFVIGFMLSSVKPVWLDAWEGEVTGKWVDDYEDSEGDDVYVYEIELDGEIVKKLPKSKWSKMKKGDYLAKFKGSYKIEVMDGKTKKIQEVKKDAEAKKVDEAKKANEAKKVEGTDLKKDTEVKKVEGTNLKKVEEVKKDTEVKKTE